MSTNTSILPAGLEHACYGKVGRKCPHDLPVVPVMLVFGIHSVGRGWKNEIVGRVEHRATFPAYGQRSRAGLRDDRSTQPVPPPSPYGIAFPVVRETRKEV